MAEKKSVSTPRTIKPGTGRSSNSATPSSVRVPKAPVEHRAATPINVRVPNSPTPKK